MWHVGRGASARQIAARRRADTHTPCERPHRRAHRRAANPSESRFARTPPRSTWRMQIGAPSTKAAAHGDKPCVRSMR
eukprot:4371880-Prymnesium_polylepis.2